MNGCERHLEDLALLLAGEIDAGRRAALERHLATCAACARASAALDRAFEELRAGDAPDPGPVYWSGFEARFRARLASRRIAARRRLLYAAAAVLLAATGFGILIGRRAGGDGPGGDAGRIAAGGESPAAAAAAAAEGDRAEARLEAALHAVRARASDGEEFEEILDEIAPGDPYAFTEVALQEPDWNTGV